MALDIRRAEAKDLGTLVNLGLLAMPDDPQWNYRYPNRKTYPDDHLQCTTESWARFFRRSPEGEGEWVVLLVYHTPAEGKEQIPISFSVWQFPPGSRIKPTDEPDLEASLGSGSQSVDCKNRRDWNKARVDAFKDGIAAAQKEKFDNMYGQNQVHLQILGTHPEYRGQGAASALVRWGIKEAGSRKLPITVFASPMGKLLYSYLGFKERGPVKIQVDGDEAAVFVEAMVYEVSQGTEVKAVKGSELVGEHPAQ